MRNIGFFVTIALQTAAANGGVKLWNCESFNENRNDTVGNYFGHFLARPSSKSIIKFRVDK